MNNLEKIRFTFLDYNEDNAEKVLRTLSLRSIIRDFYEEEVKRIIHNKHHLEVSCLENSCL